jgi:hypothetical protein
MKKLLIVACLLASHFSYASVEQTDRTNEVPLWRTQRQKYCVIGLGLTMGITGAALKTSGSSILEKDRHSVSGHSQVILGELFYISGGVMLANAIILQNNQQKVNLERDNRKN